MSKRQLKVVWSKGAVKSLKKIYEDLNLKSPSAAKKVRTEILKSCASLINYPEKYQLDEYYPNNTGTIRRFFRWNYRIVYEVKPDQINILIIIHTKRHPDKIQPKK